MVNQRRAADARSSPNLHRRKTCPDLLDRSHLASPGEHHAREQIEQQLSMRLIAEANRYEIPAPEFVRRRR